jgi:hypothetical protein
MDWRLTYAESGIRLPTVPRRCTSCWCSPPVEHPIRASVAVAAARELFAAGCRTPQAMEAASWQDRVDALGRGHYRRYDERTATMLGTGARLCLDRWRGDLRRLHGEADGDPAGLRRLLTEFPGIGPTGADRGRRRRSGRMRDCRATAALGRANGWDCREPH